MHLLFTAHSNIGNRIHYGPNPFMLIIKISVYFKVKCHYSLFDSDADCQNPVGIWMVKYV